MKNVVAAVIHDELNGYLCGYREDHNGWEFVGGKVEEGETDEEALIREVQEELGCVISVQSPIEVTHHGTITLKSFFAKIEYGAPECRVHKEIRWVKRDELLGLEWLPADLPTVRTVVERGDE